MTIISPTLTNKLYTFKQIKKNVICDLISKKRNGNIVFRRGFFYRHDYDATQFANRITQQLDNLKIAYEIVDFGEHYVKFRGGALLQNQSHWYVTIKLV